MTDAARGPSPSLPVHETTYRALREQILFGGLQPGKAVTLRGLAETLGVSLTPVREAVRRLIAENALAFHDNRRVTIPLMTPERYQQIKLARSLLEPTLAELAIAELYSTPALAQRLKDIDDATDRALGNGDIEGYMRGNYEFHMGIYQPANSDVILPLVQSLWIQFGPFMRQVYGHYGREPMVDQHKAALNAIECNDTSALKQAIFEDIQQGMRFIAQSSFASQ